MIRIVTDTGSDILSDEAKTMGVDSLELRIEFDGKTYDQQQDKDFSTFYKNVKASRKKDLTIHSVEQKDFETIFAEARDNEDEVLVLTVARSINGGTFDAARNAQSECRYGGISLMDTGHVSFAQRILVERALKLRDEGMGLEAIRKDLDDVAKRIYIVGFADNFLRIYKGDLVEMNYGMAFRRQAVSAKPIISWDDGKLGFETTAFGVKRAFNAVWTKFDITGYDEAFPVWFGHVNARDRGEAFMQASVANFNLKPEESTLYDMGGLFGQMVGPKSVFIAFVRPLPPVIEEEEYEDEEEEDGPPRLRKSDMEETGYRLG